MTYPNIFDDEPLFNSILLNGVISPGKVTLSGHESKITWDVKTGPALIGASVTFKGEPPVEFSASFYLVKDVTQGIDDFQAWPAFQAIIDGTVKPGVGIARNAARALPIYHPDLVSNGILSVVKASVGGMMYDGKGGANIVVKFQVYKAPKIVPLTLKGSGTDPDPNAAAKAEVAKLTAQYKATPWG